MKRSCNLLCLQTYQALTEKHELNPPKREAATENFLLPAMKMLLTSKTIFQRKIFKRSCNSSQFKIQCFFILNPNWKKNEVIFMKRVAAIANLLLQAMKMLRTSKWKFPAAEIYDTIQIQFPDFDHGHTDNWNVWVVFIIIEVSNFLN